MSLTTALRKAARTAGRQAAPKLSALKSTVAGEWMEGELSLDTRMVHAGVEPDERTGAIMTPVFLSTAFVQESVEKYLEKGYSYTRSGNPTVTALEARVADMEAGAGAACVSTGMAATTLVISGTMNSGDHCIMTDCSYGGTNRAAREHFMDKGMEFDFVDFRDLENVRKAIKPNTKLIFSESPTNPTLNIVDMQAVSDLAKENNLVHVCDSTFATPVICRPLDHGCDLVITSLTKYYCGHNISVGGAVIAATPELNERMKFMQNVQGNIISPMTAYMMLQTSKTMGLRVRQQCKTAQALAEYLEAHPKVEKVVYPGLDSFPQKELADKYHRDGLHGGMLWFDVKGGDTAAIKMMNTIQRPWSLCENLGATESIITACAVMTHANMLPEDRRKVGISDGFIRVSCGIEDTADLIKSLGESLDQV